MEADGDNLPKGARKGDKDLSVEDYEIKQRSEDNEQDNDIPEMQLNEQLSRAIPTVRSEVSEPDGVNNLLEANQAQPFNGTSRFGSLIPEQVENEDAASENDNAANNL